MKNDRFSYLARDYRQGFPAHCGFEVDRVESGVFETHLTVRKMHRQQDGFVHAGVMATMADHTAGYAAFTLVPDNQRILTIEFKINYFKPAVGESIICRSRVIHPGKKVLVSESEVYSVHKKSEKLVAKAMVTLMAVVLDQPESKRTQSE
jgi:uncharacterized protein (TIGR00369 family)